MQPALDRRAEPLAAFLAWERHQPERYERVAGVVSMMTGGTLGHNKIMLNCVRVLASRLGRPDCSVFASDVKVVSPLGDVMYPDVVVACGGMSDRATELHEPVVVVEVLSDSTASRDHGVKRWAYQATPSLQHYVLIGQAEPVVEVATRDADGTWRSVISRGLEGRIRLDALSVEIGLAQVYERVEFEPAPAAAAEGIGRGEADRVQTDMRKPSS